MRRRVFVFLLSVAAAVSSAAQTYERDDENSERYSVPLPEVRREIVVPDINGYKVLKADLHVHTVYSDAMMTPKYRVMEAWRDGMDVIAITDHIEYRPHEKYMEMFLDVFIDEAGNNPKIGSELNQPVTRAVSANKYYGMTVIPGVEITRNPEHVGHFNALFTKDNNLIPDENPLQAIRNAKKQGAIIQINHPGWRREDNDFTPVALEALKEKLIDGVEVFNTREFYPNVIERAAGLGLYVSGCSDLHRGSYDMCLQHGFYRNMTLILAKDNSRNAIRDALTGRRTIAYSYGHFAADEQLLADMFNACVSIEHFYTHKNGKRYYKITNKSSFPFYLAFSADGHTVTVPSMSSIIRTEEDDTLTVYVKNMWYGPDKHPVVKVAGK